MYDVLILGGGPAGCTAALYAARSGLRCALLEGRSAGGQMLLTGRIENYPGVSCADGTQLAEQMRRQAEDAGAQWLGEKAISVELTAETKTVRTASAAYTARTLIAATGASPRRLGLPEELRLTGRGVSYCAACDGMFFRGKRVAVVGGGNTAAGDALLLSKLCTQVHLIHRRSALRAGKAEQAALAGLENLSIHWDTEVTALMGGEFLEEIRLKNRATGEESCIAVDGVFVAVGAEPESKLFRGVLAMDEGGFLQTNAALETSIPGVFAAGDVRSGAIRQIITAAADGAAAAISAAKTLNK